jgi:hypothetical protein
MPHISRLSDAPAREAWPHEALDFTPWLAENLDHLSDVLGIPLELEGTEVAVESFSADILARNGHNDTRVLVENQLATTDHSHLGQLMTYLAGLDVHTVVWIATDFREPHLSAIKWLNEHTSEGFSFFAIKLRVVRIGDSPLAPILDVVERPNTWERQVQAAVSPKSGQITEIGQFRKDFWDAYLERHPGDRDIGATESAASNLKLKVSASSPVTASLWVGKNRGVGLFLRGPRGSISENIRDQLAPLQDALEQTLGVSMNPNLKYGQFFEQEASFDLSERQNWIAAIDWLHEKARTYYEALETLDQS